MSDEAKPPDDSDWTPPSRWVVDENFEATQDRYGSFCPWCGTRLDVGNAMLGDVTKDDVQPWETPDPDTARIYIPACLDCVVAGRVEQDPDTVELPRRTPSVPPRTGVPCRAHQDANGDWLADSAPAEASWHEVGAVLYPAEGSIVDDLRAENERLMDLLRVARCPDTQCQDGAIPVGDPHGDYWWEQCQWCDERDALAHREPTPEADDE